MLTRYKKTHYRVKDFHNYDDILVSINSGICGNLACDTSGERTLPLQVKQF